MSRTSHFQNRNYDQSENLTGNYLFRLTREALSSVGASMTLPTRTFLFVEENSLSSTGTANKPNKRLPKRKRTIRFQLESIEVHPIPHIDDLSEDEVNDVWYEREDYERMKQALVPVIRRIMKGERVAETNQETARGLEFRTREGAMKRQHNKLDSINAVLDEQDRQKTMGIDDDEKLREIYLSRSAHCLQEARELGMKDELAMSKMRARKTNIEVKDKKKKGLKTRTLSLVDEIKNLALSRRVVVNNAA